MRGIDLIEIDDGKNVANTAYYDGMAFAREIGLLPAQDSGAERAMKGAVNAATKAAARGCGRPRRHRRAARGLRPAEWPHDRLRHPRGRLVWWIAAWAFGIKAFDAFLLTAALVVGAAAYVIVKPLLDQDARPRGRPRSSDDGAR